MFIRVLHFPNWSYSFKLGTIPRFAFFFCVKIFLQFFLSLNRKLPQREPQQPGVVRQCCDWEMSTTWLATACMSVQEEAKTQAVENLDIGLTINIRARHFQMWMASFCFSVLVTYPHLPSKNIFFSSHPPSSRRRPSRSGKSSLWSARAHLSNPPTIGPCGACACGKIRRAAQDLEIIFKK